MSNTICTVLESTHSERTRAHLDDQYVRDEGVCAKQHRRAQRLEYHGLEGGLALTEFELESCYSMHWHVVALRVVESSLRSFQVSSSHVRE